jgi:heme exporter protein B
MSVVELDDAVAVLGQFPALAGATLRVEQGEIVLLRGPNGAGKTTLLRLCAGLVPLVRGSGSVLGLDLSTHRESVRRTVGLLGHQNGLYLDLTVAENVRFWGSTVGASAAEMLTAMQRLDVAGRLADVVVGKLSAGQKRRTALACLIARRAQLWLLDEPHAGLDASARDELDQTLRQAATAGATILVASHELERAGSLATRAVDVIAGRVHEVVPRDGEPGRREPGRRVSTLRIARLVAAKDLRVEWHSRVFVNQVLPFAGVTMVIFAFALDADSVLQRVAPGLVWLATMFSMLVLVQRAFAVETADGALDALRVAGVDPTAIYLGKAVALGVQLLVLEVVLLCAAVVLYGQTIPAGGAVLLVTTLISATCGLAAVGTLYGGLAAGFTGRETLLPLLTFPAVAPVLIGATRAVEAALGTAGAVVSDGWPWVGLLAVFAVAFGVGGALAFGPLIDE